jgi:methylated-DNA-[protein]-cysteine S-methyltransferase
MAYYTLFRTPWGWFGIVGRDEVVCRTSLPAANRAAALAGLLAGLDCRPEDARFQKGLFRSLQERIIAYFEGENVDFSTDPPVCLDAIGPFGRRVLRACRKVPFGRTTTYSALAKQIGRPTAARAVGGAMAANPVPLIVPCHRVLRTDGRLGGFTSPGGTAAKQRLVRHEQPAHCRAPA